MLRLSGPSRNINEKTIDILGEDSLVSIFEYLTIKDKLQLELVNKRWNQVAKRSWRLVTKLEVCPAYLKNHTKDSKSAFFLQSNNHFQDKNTTHLITILKRCGKYLIELDMKNCSIFLEFPRFQNAILKYCKQITSLIIEDSCFNDFFIELLFKSLKNLRSLTLNNFCFKERYFEKLETSNIEKLTIRNCEIKSTDYIFKFILNLKKLKKLKLFSCSSEIVTKIFKALSVAENNNLLEFSVDKLRVIEFINMLSKQKNLEKLSIKDSELHLSQIEKLPNESLKTLKIDFSRVYLNILLQHFPNLETLNFYFFSYFDASCLEEIVEYVNENIRNIALNYSEFKLHYCTPINSFSRLINLESFTIFQREACEESCCNDFILENLSKCENLKYLFIHNCNLKWSKFNQLKKFANLIKLHITAADDCINTCIDDEKMSELIKTLVNLKELKLQNFVFISNYLMDLANQIKKDRGDPRKNKLKIILQHCNASELHLISN